MSFKPLSGHVALVTGASRGIGKGIALQLGEAGATVYVTGRAPGCQDRKLASNALPTLEQTANEITVRGGYGIAVFCDHSDSQEVKNLFEKIEKEQNGQLDILVNNAFSAVAACFETTGKKFYDVEPSIFDDVNNVALKNHYVCSVYAARLMVPRKKGFIVTISSYGGVQKIYNIAYTVGKSACDRMAADMAHELLDSNVASISLWPGAVKTELVTATANEEKKKALAQAESTEFSGKCIVALATDPKLLEKTGRILTTTDLAKDYNLCDIDGTQPRSERLEPYRAFLVEKNKTYAPQNLA
ncbi:hypothetical protein L596_009827 [Steinernema carpocapsae]|uniref:Dehydrogenase/reductase SDR family member 1 n=1 Tax=Steinernema carpocapsae TaxID=34508 RepID=A0A4V6A6P7_STECR|nr:hypothetical protein L596_009827 [Steinernema carpocapsae]